MVSRNGKIRLEDRKFFWESGVKEEYLDFCENRTDPKPYRKSTIKTIKSKLLKVDEYEQKMGKSVYNLNFEEIDDLMNSQFLIKSRNMASGTMSYIIGYIDFCIKKNLVKHRENRFKILNKDDKYKFVSPHAEQNKYLTKEERRNSQSKLVNPCDKLIIELIPLGVRGRTQLGNTNEELRNLRNEDVDFENRVLTLRNNDGDERYIYNLDNYTLELLEQTINQTEYEVNNGIIPEGKTNAIKRIINKTDYVFRTAGRNKHGKVKSQYFGTRINKIIKEYCEDSYITVTNLYFSGMIDYAKQILLEKDGEPLTLEDYSKIRDRFDYGQPIELENGEQSWYNVLIKIKGMVEDYFNAQKQKEEDKRRLANEIIT
jgi:integrase